jgi:organic hydroperoxide reductase OsmC/OhrA
MKPHHYEVSTIWTGNRGTGTSGYRDYLRDHEISADAKPGPIHGSSDPHFRGDRTRYNPEELLLGALSACHMLTLLHLCADAGIVVTEYRDDAAGTMRENPDWSGEFVSVTLRPRIKITDRARADETLALNHRAHQLCFIARSVNFPVLHEAEIIPCD